SVWALAPSLELKEVIARILDTAVQTGECARYPAPVLDVYEAVLAADSEKVRDKDMRFRRALLDVFNDQSKLTSQEDGFEPDERLTLGDLLTFVDALRALGLGSFPAYSRYDLNDDGFASTYHRSSFPLGGFNLDLSDELVRKLDGSGPYAKVTKEIEGIEVVFDEATITDAEVLCYYAYDSIYNGGSLSDKDRVERTVAMLPVLRDCGLGLKSVELKLDKLADGWVQPDPARPIVFKAFGKFLPPRSSSIPTSPFILNAEDTYNVPSPSGGIPANYGNRASTVEVSDGRLVLTAI